MTDVLEIRQVHHLQDPERQEAWESSLSLEGNGELGNDCKETVKGHVSAWLRTPGGWREEVKLRAALRRNGNTK